MYRTGKTERGFLLISFEIRNFPPNPQLRRESNENTSYRKISIRNYVVYIGKLRTRDRQRQGSIPFRTYSCRSVRLVMRGIPVEPYETSGYPFAPVSYKVSEVGIVFSRSPVVD